MFVLSLPWQPARPPDHRAGIVEIKLYYLWGSLFGEALTRGNFCSGTHGAGLRGNGSFRVNFECDASVQKYRRDITCFVREIMPVTRTQIRFCTINRTLIFL